MFQVYIMENHIARYYDVFSVQLKDNKTYFLIYEYRNNERWKWVRAENYIPVNSD